MYGAGGVVQDFGSRLGSSIRRGVIVATRSLDTLRDQIEKSGSFGAALKALEPQIAESFAGLAQDAGFYAALH